MIGLKKSFIKNISKLQSNNGGYVRVFEIIHHLKRIEEKYLFEQFTPDADYNSTVGGPTNIASITKGDDIKWIKK